MKELLLLSTQEAYSLQRLMEMEKGSYELGENIPEIIRNKWEHIIACLAFKAILYIIYQMMLWTISIRSDSDEFMQHFGKACGLAFPFFIYLKLLTNADPHSLAYGHSALEKYRRDQKRCFSYNARKADLRVWVLPLDFSQRKKFACSPALTHKVQLTIFLKGDNLFVIPHTKKEGRGQL